ncbi:hypothetical protein [Mesorhizobium atlanticum]|uniref:Uncharacterized protein n=1 Tax=Mesorhizobium atlanticum TaxID=2233532 RepID=A0A330GSG6_9HYPH|nr:hypothetical protein [Mesorhizobium atlanticum]RAZ75846.1 hypothetical protein DPM35_13945 [Mesorhizobium atlanticum]
MTRVRIDKNGIAIAKEGYDVDTAPLSKMQFSPLFGAMRLAMKGMVTVADYSGYMSDIYRRAIVVFPTAFPKPPIVMVAGQRSDGSTDQTVLLGTAASDQSNRAWHEPVYQIVTSTTQFEFYLDKSTWGNNPSRTLNWRYWVFRNTIED